MKIGAYIGDVTQSVRIIRTIKIFFYLNNSTIISDILVLALPFLLNTLIIIAVVLYIYSIVGLNIFPYIKWRTGITANTNFSSFGLSVFTLISISTGENWNNILEDCLKETRANDLCVEINSYQDFKDANFQFIACGNYKAYIYFISFIILFGYTLLNLLTGIVIETFYLRAKLAGSIVKSKDIQQFFKIWQALDVESTGLLHWKEAKLILCLLNPPLGLLKEFRKDNYLDELWMNIKLPLYVNKSSRLIYIHVYDMALALTKLAVQLDDFHQEYITN